MAETHRIDLGDIQSDEQVVELAQELHRDETAANKFEFNFSSWEKETEGRDDLRLNWDPLLRELETSEKLENVKVAHILMGRIRPLYCNQFFQALQRNPKVKSLKLSCLRFASNNSEGIVNFLNGATSLRDLAFCSCFTARHSEVIREIVAAVQCNLNRLHSLEFCSVMCESELMCPILQSLTSFGSSCCLGKLSYTAGGARFGDKLLKMSTAEAFQQYLESPSATIQCLRMNTIHFRHDWPEATLILQALSRNTSVKELEFEFCNIPRGKRYPHQLLASLVANRSALRITNCNFFRQQQFSDAVVEALVQKGSALRMFEFDVNEKSFTRRPIETFRKLMSAVGSSSQLERLTIREIRTNDADHFRTLLDGIVRSKVTEVTLHFKDQRVLKTERHRTEQDQCALLEAIQRNYIVQNVECKPEYGRYWFSEANEAQLELYLDRNRKLAKWIKNPKLVPQELWPEAVMLALKAGANSLYQSLLALSGHGIGLRQGSRKRKRPEHDDPGP